MNKKTILLMMITGLTLGTAWAVRGKFGHEQGAAWAGAIGGLVIILLSGRKDWFQKIYISAFAAAIGWGMGGMMSYGVVVGFGKANDFPNVFYGLTMLFIIGGLYGLTGGGMLGLALEHTKEKKVDWARLILEMTIGGFLFYGFFISQLGWKMTPPRSELWGACMGAGLALIWFLYRNKYKSPLRVALYSMLGAGFGFASGNFLQTVIQSFGIPFSGWNTMEYSIGFWGGLGMAYGVFTSNWEKPKDICDSVINPVSSIIALISVALIIPFLVWQQTFETEKMVQLAENLNFQNVKSAALAFQIIVIALILLMATVLVLHYFQTKSNHFEHKTVLIHFLFLFAVYIVISDIRTGSLFTLKLPEQKLYWVNFLVILIFILKNKTFVWMKKVDQINFKKFWLFFIFIIVIIGILAFVAINIHEPIPGSHQRFPV